MQRETLAELGILIIALCVAKVTTGIDASAGGMITGCGHCRVITGYYPPKIGKARILR